MRIAADLTEYINDTTTELPIQIDFKEAVAQIIKLHQDNSGSTFNLYFGNVIGQPLYAVSVCPERTRLVLYEDALQNILERFIANNKELLDDPRNCIGTWYDEDGALTFVDITSTIPNKAQAEELGRTYNQMAIYDLSSNATIETGGSGEKLSGWPPIEERLPTLVRGN